MLLLLCQQTQAVGESVCGEGCHSGKEEAETQWCCQYFRGSLQSPWAEIWPHVLNKMGWNAAVRWGLLAPELISPPTFAAHNFSL